jgi:hypothetical protein
MRDHFTTHAKLSRERYGSSNMKPQIVDSGVLYTRAVASRLNTKCGEFKMCAHRESNAGFFGAEPQRSDLTTNLWAP